MKNSSSFTVIMAILVVLLLSGCSKFKWFPKPKKPQPVKIDTGLVVSMSYQNQNSIAYGGMKNYTLAYITIEANKGSAGDSFDITDLYLRSENKNRLLDNSINNVRLVVGSQLFYPTFHDSMIAFESMSFLKMPGGGSIVCTLQCDVSAIMNTMDSITFRLQMATVSSNPFGQTPGTVNGVRAYSMTNGQLVHTELANKIVSSYHRFARGYPSMFKTNITFSASEAARIDMTARGNRVHITGMQLQLINIVMNNNVTVQVYAGGLSGDLVYSGPPTSTIVFNQPGHTYVEIPQNQTETFSVKVLNAVPTVNGTLPNMMGVKIDNVYYTDKLNNGDVAITDLSKYKNVGLFPFIWSQ